jgi:hypothetical protein
MLHLNRYVLEYFYDALKHLNFEVLGTAEFPNTVLACYIVYKKKHKLKMLFWFGARKY